MTDSRLESVRSRMATACRKAGRDPSEVALLAVSKLHTAKAVRLLFAQGQHRFGENRVQEALPKQSELEDIEIEWHFIGPIQSNKTREIAEHFDWVQSVDREKILDRLSGQRPASHPPLNICIQVNIDREPQKSGLDPDDVPAFAKLASQRNRLCLRGLMCIPALTDDPGRQVESFRRMRTLFERLRSTGHEVDTLSMGMSADLEYAIAEGSTMVRVGTDLFGPRPNANAP